MLKTETSPRCNYSWFYFILTYLRSFAPDFDMQPSLYPGKVLSLKMQKPEGFRYRAGMYMFVQCPEISPFEW